MNYKVLYRKYRPDSFDGLIGQNHIVSILRNSIKDNKIAHAYLFSGPRGTGKTSTARILAKSVNCLNNTDGVACDKCESCLSFSTNPDIIEIDAASNNGVDEIRELINNVKIMPTSMKYKVYIIDEVHMLSQSAFNALLLTLEEPPEHVIFILATTNLESVPITIVSRCQKFDFKKISENEILERLRYVCDKEKIKYDEDGLMEVALLSDGGLRDALSILDQLSKNDKLINAELVTSEIGSVSSKKIYDLLTFFDQKDVEKICNVFEEFQNININYKVVIKKLINALSEIGVSVLNRENKWHIDFDICKEMVFELNDIINKISINVDAYLLIKMVFLSYLTKVDNNDVKSDKKNNNTTKIIENSDLKEDLVEPKKTTDKENDFVDIRINNCFVNANKKYLSDLKSLWSKFIDEVKDPLIKGLISDTEVVTASDSYAIVVTLLKHKDLEINSSLVKIEELFSKYKMHYKLIFIDEDKWKEEKQKYINNLKNNYKYTYVYEDGLSNEKDDVSSYSEVFDINKIEVE